jgi:hypothetical protein
MTPDEVNDRIERLFQRKGIKIVDASEQPAGEQPAVAPPAQAEPPHMKNADVILPEGVPQHGDPMVLARFRAFWSHLVNENFPGEIRQPTLDQYNAWREEDANRPDEPSPVAHLITVSDETWEQIQARSDWNRPPSESSENYTPSSRRGTFGDGFRRPGGA